VNAGDKSSCLHLADANRAVLALNARAINVDVATSRRKTGAGVIPNGDVSAAEGYIGECPSADCGVLGADDVVNKRTSANSGVALGDSVV
jgi:hypothetical protein